MKRFVLRKGKTGSQKTLGIGIGLFEMCSGRAICIGINLIRWYITFGVHIDSLS